MGSSLWVHFTVVNQGLAPASGFVSLVRVEKTVTYPGTLVHEENPTQTPLTLGVGQSATLSPVRVDLDPGPDNTIEARMFVDHGNAVAEKDEGNNWCTAYYTAQTTPSTKPKQALASQAAQQGGFVSKVTVERNGTKLDEHTKTLIVGAGLSYRWPIPLPLEGTGGQVPYLGGTNVFKASVVSDAGAAVQEVSETNNSCATQFTVDFTYGP